MGSYLKKKSDFWVLIYEELRYLFNLILNINFVYNFDLIFSYFIKEL